MQKGNRTESIPNALARQTSLSVAIVSTGAEMALLKFHFCIAAKSTPRQVIQGKPLRVVESLANSLLSQ